MKIILECECGEEFEIETFDGEEIEVECHICHTTIRATACGKSETFVIDETFERIEK